MQIPEALEIVRALADGIDPNTGEIFPEGTPYQHPQVIRALMTALQALEQRRNDKGYDPLPMRAGKAWDKAEDEQLVRDFEAGVTLVQLAKRHERTRGSIRSRLEKLGKIPPFGNLPIK
jgi:hypothetical protein